MAAFNLEGHQAGDPGRQRAGSRWKEEARATPFLPMLGVVVITQLHQIVPTFSHESQEYGCKWGGDSYDIFAQKVTELAETTSDNGGHQAVNASSHFDTIHFTSFKKPWFGRLMTKSDQVQGPLGSRRLRTRVGGI